MGNNFTLVKGAAHDVITWVNENKDIESELKKRSVDLVYDAASLYNKLDAFGSILDNNKTIGVFGESQAGKSYLVSKLVTDGKSDLILKWDEDRFDFIKNINPPGGGAESSAFVTRFSAKEYQAPQGFPVHFKLFKETEILMILINSFFQDYDPKTIDFDLNSVDFVSHIKECDNAKYQLDANEKPCNITNEDIVELIDYVKEASSSKLKNLNYDNAYWQYALLNINKLNIEGRVFFFSILWDKVKVVSTLYKKLTQELSKLNYQNSIYAPISVFVNVGSNREFVQRDNNIIKVDALSGIMDCKESVDICTDCNGDNKASIEFSSLAALICEFVLNPQEKSKYIQAFDILDMPGARSRELSSQRDLKDEDQNFSVDRITEVKADSLIAKVLNEKFRRGKVAYLFDRYSKRGEFEVLLYCIAANKPNQEVRTLPGIVRKYIEDNIGVTPEARALVDNTLVGVFTKFDDAIDTQIKNNIKNGNEPDTKAKIDAILDDFKAENWMSNFRGKGDEFNNFFFVRNPEYAKYTTWLDVDENGVEHGVKESERDNFDRVVNDYLKNNTTFTKRVKDPKKLFEEIQKDDGAVGYLADSLYSTYHDCSNRERNFKARLQAILNRVLDIKSFASMQGSEAKAEIRADSQALAFKLLQINSVCNIVYILKDNLEPLYDEISDIYNRCFDQNSVEISFAKDVVAKLIDKIDLLSNGSLNTILASAIVKNIMAKKAILLPQNLPFFFEGTELKSKANLDKEIKIVLSNYAQALKEIALSSHIDLAGKLSNLLSKNKLMGAGRDVSKLRYVGSAIDFISDFIANFGANLKDDVLKNNFFEKRIENDNITLVCRDLKSEFDNKANFYTRDSQLDCGIIKLDGENEFDYYQSYLADYMSNFISMYEDVKSTSDSAYKFTREQNEKLCDIIKKLKNLQE